MTWFSALPSAGVCLLILFLPGSALLTGLGKVGAARWMPAPLVSVALIGVTGIVGGLLNLPWNIFSFSLLSALTTVTVWVIHRRFVKSKQSVLIGLGSLRANVGTIVGLSIGATAQTLILVKAFVSPESIAQRFDNVFHLNAIQWILETGDASSLTLNHMTGIDSAVAVYPSAWHSLCALIVQIAAIPVPAAANISNVVIGGLIWPMGCMYLARVVLGPKLASQLVAGVAAASFAVYPLAILDFGPLYPNVLSYSLVPIALGLIVKFTRRTPRWSAKWFEVIVIVGAIFAALLLSQPNGLITLLVLSLPLLASRWLSRLSEQRSHPSFRRSIAVHWTLLGLASVALLLLWNFLRPSDPSGGWPPIQSTGSALGESLINGTMGRHPAWLISGLIFFGIFVAAQRPKLRWVVGSYVLSTTLFVVAASAPAGPVRSWLTGGWYNDSYRLAAIIPITGVLLTALASDSAAITVTNWARSWRALTPGGTRGLVGTVYTLCSTLALGAVLVGINYSAVPPALQGASAAYTDGQDAPLLSADEYELLRRLPKEVPADAVVAANPWNGGALAYAVSGTHVTLKHLITEVSPEVDAINRSIDVATPDSAACTAAKKLNVRYVLDFGPKTFLNSPEAHRFEGLSAGRGASLRLVDSQGSASLLEIVGC